MSKMKILIDAGHGHVVHPIEIWKDIPGWEGLYQVSNLGRIKALRKSYTICNSSTVNTDEKIMRQHYSRGYLTIELNHNGFARSYGVHRLVAMAFIDNPENKPHIDHINTIRDDNRVENLRWVTAKENAANPLTHKRRLEVAAQVPFGEGNPLFEEKSPDSKPVLQFDADGNFVARYACCHQAERRNKGFHFSNIARACRGERKTYKGYIWAYETV